MIMTISIIISILIMIIGIKVWLILMQTQLSRL